MPGPHCRTESDISNSAHFGKSLQNIVSTHLPRQERGEPSRASHSIEEEDINIMFSESSHVATFVNVSKSKLHIMTRLLPATSFTTIHISLLSPPHLSDCCGGSSTRQSVSTTTTTKTFPRFQCNFHEIRYNEPFRCYIPWSSRFNRQLALHMVPAAFTD
jgi:hypothetical protein